VGVRNERVGRGGRSKWNELKGGPLPRYKGLEPLDEGARATVPSPSALGGRLPGFFNCLSVASCLSPLGREKEIERALARWRTK
jgi:hypothetical protein